MPPEKVIPRRNYGSVPHLLGSRLGAHDKYLDPGQDAIVRRGGRDRHDRPYASLKLDGTNVGVVLLDGRPRALQRKGYDCASSPYRMHHAFDAWVRDHAGRFAGLLAEGERVAGEWLWQASGIRYEVSGAPFFAFDVFAADNTRLPWEAMVGRVEAAGLRVPAWERLPDLAGEGAAGALLTRLADRLPAVRPLDAEHEGVVVRVERRGAFDFMGKWVRADFEPGRYLPGLTDDSPAEEILNVVRYGLPQRDDLDVRIAGHAEEVLTVERVEAPADGRLGAGEVKGVVDAAGGEGDLGGQRQGPAVALQRHPDHLEIRTPQQVVDASPRLARVDGVREANLRDRREVLRRTVE